MIKNMFLVGLITFSASALAYGVLESEWDDGFKRYCKYSDGKVIAISFTSICPQSN
jgi:hypothetical protein